MSSSNRRTGAFLSQSPRRQGGGAVAIDLYKTNSGFRFLTNFVLFGWLTLACLTLSSGLSSSGHLGGLPDLGGLFSQNATSEPNGPAAAAQSGDAPTPGFGDGRGAALAEALQPTQQTPAAPEISDYKLTLAAFGDAPVAARAALEQAISAYADGRSSGAIRAAVRTLDPFSPAANVINGLADLHEGDGASAQTGLILLKRAADAGSVAGMALYGLASLSPPYAMPADDSAGRLWLQKAADGGDAQAALILARGYLSGAAGYSDPAQAQRLLRRAHELGDSRSTLILAGLVARGVAGAADPAEAEQLVRIAAARGDVAAMTVLGHFLATVAVKSGATSFDEAVLWLGRSAEQGDLSAMEQLGDIQMFLAKAPPMQDPAKGFAWFQRCADGGRGACDFALGRAYSLSLGVAGDMARAWAYMSLARDHGVPHASDELQTIETRLTPSQRSEGVSILAQLKNAPPR